MTETEGAGIIYCNRRKLCDAVCDDLSDNGINCEIFHAGILDLFWFNLFRGHRNLLYGSPKTRK